MNRREFIQLLSIASAAGILPGSIFGQRPPLEHMYDIPKFGSTRLLHFTDCHAQLMPVFFREPHVNIGVGDAKGKPPHIVGQALLNHFKLPAHDALAHAFTYLNYEKAAEEYGKVGGFAYLATVIKQLRTTAGQENCLLLDGGDTWQGSGTAFQN